jgi:hypothetical protein
MARIAQLCASFRHGLRSGGASGALALLRSRLRPEGSHAPPEGTESAQHHQIQRAIRQALAGYAPRPHDVRIVLLRAREQPAGYYDPTVGWDRLTTAGTEVHVVPGDHGSYLAQHLTAFAERLRACLDAAHAGARMHVDGADHARRGLSGVEEQGAVTRA